jgi:hypothetical protein
MSLKCKVKQDLATIHENSKSQLLFNVPASQEERTRIYIFVQQFFKTLKFTLDENQTIGYYYLDADKRQVTGPYPCNPYELFLLIVYVSLCFQDDMDLFKLGMVARNIMAREYDEDFVDRVWREVFALIAC